MPLQFYQLTEEDYQSDDSQSLFGGPSTLMSSTNVLQTSVQSGSVHVHNFQNRGIKAFASFLLVKIDWKWWNSRIVFHSPTEISEMVQTLFNLSSLHDRLE
jgi:hypothetical protein